MDKLTDEELQRAVASPSKVPFSVVADMATELLALRHPQWTRADQGMPMPRADIWVWVVPLGWCAPYPENGEYVNRMAIGYGPTQVYWRLREQRPEPPEVR